MLLRWNIGPCSELGEEVFKKSVRMACNFCAADIRLVVCYYNRESPKNLPEHVELLDISDLTWSYPKPSNEIFNLFPLRLDINNYEIYLDNELIIHQPPRSFKRFLLSKNKFLKLESGNDNYGIFSGLNPKNPPHTSYALFGFPPGYNPEKDINEIIKERPIENWDNGNAHGLIAGLLNSKICYSISELEISTFENGFKPAACGYHFKGISKKRYDQKWKDFNNLTLNFI